MDSAEKAEWAYIKHLASEELDKADRYFATAYPNGFPFLPQESDRPFIENMEQAMRLAIARWTDMFPEWTDEDIWGFAAIVTLSVINARFKRMDHATRKLPEHAMMVEAILDAPSIPPPLHLAANDHRKPPFLRLVANNEKGSSS